MRFWPALVLCYLLSAAEPGFRPLFDGKTLNGWKLVAGHGAGYVVENGMIVCPEGGGEKLMTEEEFDNFVLRFEYRIFANGNNGMNGVTILDASLDIVKEPKVLEKHPGLLRTTGHLGLLGHNERTEFRNMRVRRLP